MIKIASWNVNSIRSRVEHLGYFIKQYDYDILLLQELKATHENFPYMEFEEMGYNIKILGQKSYNGVAIFSKFPLEDVVCGIPGYDDAQARYIEAVISIPQGALRVASVYVPNGEALDSPKFSYKMEFLHHLKKHMEQLLEYEEAIIIGGDYNIAPNFLDVYNEKLDGELCFSKQERSKFSAIANLGYIDSYRAIHPHKQQFSWWDYRGGGWQYNKGMRIDHLLISPQTADKLLECEIYYDMRGLEKASDHAPIGLKLSS